MTSKWIEALAAEFWEEVGGKDAFPRSLEDVIPVTRPVSITRLPRLCLAAIGEWLRQRRFSLPVEARDRWLHGCLIAYRGMGFIFVEGGLEADEVRMTVAHEFAHYLAEYELPRKRALRRLGASVLPVLDGDRAATREESLGAAVVGIQLGVHVHYMQRLGNGACAPPAGTVERTANALALELVAPRRVVLAEMHAEHPGLAADPNRCQGVLQKRFGLPETWARPYASRLAEEARSQRTFSEILGL